MPARVAEPRDTPEGLFRCAGRVAVRRTSPPDAPATGSARGAATISRPDGRSTRSTTARRATRSSRVRGCGSRRGVATIAGAIRSAAPTTRRIPPRTTRSRGGGDRSSPAGTSRRGAYRRTPRAMAHASRRNRSDPASSPGEPRPDRPRGGIVPGGETRNQRHVEPPRIANRNRSPRRAHPRRGCRPRATVARRRRTLPRHRGSDGRGASRPRR